MMIILSVISSPIGEIEFLLYRGEDSDLKDLIDQTDLANLDDYFVDPTPKMFNDKHAPDYSFPPRFDVYPDDFLEIKSDADNFYDDPFDFKGEKIKESKLLIDELDLPCDILPYSYYDSFASQDFSRDDVFPSPDNEDKVFNPGILIQEKSVTIITCVAQEKKLAISKASLVFEDFDPLFYEPPVFKDVPNSMRLLLFSFENEEKVFKPGIYTSEKVHSCFLPELSHPGYHVFKVNQIFISQMKIFHVQSGKNTPLLDASSSSKSLVLITRNFISSNFIIVLRHLIRRLSGFPFKSKHILHSELGYRTREIKNVMILSFRMKVSQGLTKMMSLVATSRRDLKVNCSDLGFDETLRFGGFVCSCVSAASVGQSHLLDPLPTVKTAFSIISREESHRGGSSNVSNKTRATSFASNVPNQRNFSNRNRTQNNAFNRGRPTRNPNLLCTNYGFTGHTVERCYKITGFPPNFQSKRKEFASNNHASTSDNTSDHIKNASYVSADDKSAQLISKEQIAQIISLILEKKVEVTGDTKANMAGVTSKQSYGTGSGDCNVPYKQNSIFRLGWKKPLEMIYGHEPLIRGFLSV
uniref:Uncharacterized protein n=1 Tax=Tanacetum cinerariifolium TaxID=118510 RepID=A0A6L2K6M0_TANCI|nr:hypothetical protein [Tanacetum cinerariifolium]